MGNSQAPAADLASIGDREGATPAAGPLPPEAAAEEELDAAALPVQERPLPRAEQLQAFMALSIQALAEPEKRQQLMARAVARGVLRVNEVPLVPPRLPLQRTAKASEKLSTIFNEASRCLTRAGQQDRKYGEAVARLLDDEPAAATNPIAQPFSRGFVHRKTGASVVNHPPVLLAVENEAFVQELARQTPECRPVVVAQPPLVWAAILGNRFVCRAILQRMPWDPVPTRVLAQGELLHEISALEEQLAAAKRDAASAAAGDAAAAAPSLQDPTAPAVEDDAEDGRLAGVNAALRQTALKQASDTAAGLLMAHRFGNLFGAGDAAAALAGVDNQDGSSDEEEEGVAGGGVGNAAAAAGDEGEANAAAGQQAAPEDVDPDAEQYPEPVLERVDALARLLRGGGADSIRRASRAIAFASGDSELLTRRVLRLARQAATETDASGWVVDRLPCDPVVLLESRPSDGLNSLQATANLPGALLTGVVGAFGVGIAGTVTGAVGGAVGGSVLPTVISRPTTTPGAVATGVVSIATGVAGGVLGAGCGLVAGVGMGAYSGVSGSRRSRIARFRYSRPATPLVLAAIANHTGCIEEMLTVPPTNVVRYNLHRLLPACPEWWGRTLIGRSRPGESLPAGAMPLGNAGWQAVGLRDRLLSDQAVPGFLSVAQLLALQTATTQRSILSTLPVAQALTKPQPQGTLPPDPKPPVELLAPSHPASVQFGRMRSLLERHTVEMWNNWGRRRRVGALVQAAVAGDEQGAAEAAGEGAVGDGEWQQV